MKEKYGEIILINKRNIWEKNAHMKRYLGEVYEVHSIKNECYGKKLYQDRMLMKIAG